MKLWAIIFTAILAAASVIGGVISWQKTKEREAVERLGRLETLTQIAKLTAERLAQTGKIEDFAAGAAETPAQFAALLKEPLPEGARREKLKSDFRYNCRVAIMAAREKGKTGAAWGEADKRTLEWADAMERALEAALP